VSESGSNVLVCVLVLVLESGCWTDAVLFSVSGSGSGEAISSGIEGKVVDGGDRVTGGISV